MREGEAQHDTERSSAGQMIMQSALLGSSSDLHLVASEPVSKGFGFSEIHSSKETKITAIVKDLSSGVVIGKDEFSNGNLKGVIDGINLNFRGDAGVNVSWDSSSSTMGYSGKAGETNYYLHFVDNRTMIQAGPT